MGARTLLEAKKDAAQAADPARPRLSQRADGGPALGALRPGYGHDFGSVRPGPAMETCPLAGPRRCPFGGACHTCPVRVQAKRAAGCAAVPLERAQAPVIVREVLYSPGEPLDAATRGLMESRLGHDFGAVRVHKDARAAESARAVDALAYTAGRDVVFGAGQYAPATPAGKSLLAHELAHVIEQESHRLGDGQEPARIQRKLRLHSEKEARAFQWFLTAADAAYFSFSTRAKPFNVTMTTPVPAKVEDAFRVNILKTIISNPTQTLLIRGFGLDEKVTPHRLFKDGKPGATSVSPTLRQMGRGGAAGVTIPSESLALGAEADYSGSVTSVPDESWIFYSSPGSLAHEFGHAFLLFSGTAWEHRRKIPKAAGTRTPEGAPFEGETDVFIRTFLEEKFAELEILDPGALHVSPTVIRKWPEPPGFRLSFTGTWLQFLAKYPGSTLKQEVTTVKGRKMRKLKVCVPKPGEICVP